MKLNVASMCLALFCTVNDTFAQQETTSTTDDDGPIKVELQPVIAGSGPVRVKVKVQNPFDRPMRFHSSYEQGCKMLEINLGKKVVEIAALGSHDVLVDILDPNNQTNSYSKLTILAQPTADFASKPIELQKYLFITPFVKTCDIVEALEGKFRQRDFDFFVINRSHRKWEEIQIESKIPNLKFTSKLISKMDASFRDQYPDLTLEYFGVKVEGNVSEPQYSVRIYAKATSSIPAFQLVGGEESLYLWHNQRR